MLKKIFTRKVAILPPMMMKLVHILVIVSVVAPIVGLVIRMSKVMRVAVVAAALPLMRTAPPPPNSPPPPAAQKFHLLQILPQEVPSRINTWNGGFGTSTNGSKSGTNQEAVPIA